MCHDVLCRLGKCMPVSEWKYKASAHVRLIFLLHDIHFYCPPVRRTTFVCSCMALSVTFCHRVYLCAWCVGLGNMEVFAFTGAPLSRRSCSAGIHCAMILATWRYHIICWHTSQRNARCHCTMLAISLILSSQSQTRSVVVRWWVARTVQ